MRPLLAFGRFADDSQRVLAAIQRFAIVDIERDLNLGVCSTKLSATSFAYSKSGVVFHDPQFTLRHEDRSTAECLCK